MRICFLSSGYLICVLSDGFSIPVEKTKKKGLYEIAGYSI